MEANKENKLDELLSKSVREAGLESPSADFTKSLLSEIALIEKRASATAYKPLISKVGWVSMALVVLVLSVLARYSKLEIQFSWLEKINTGALPKLRLMEVLPKMAVSNILLYSIMIFAIFAVIQMVFLKQRLDRQYA